MAARLLALLLLLLAVAVAVVVAAEADGGDNDSDNAPAFRYVMGGDDWTGLCARNPAQSPVDLVPQPLGGLDSQALRVFYPEVHPWQQGVSLSHDGTRLVLSSSSRAQLGYLVDAAGSRATVRRVEFHSPSEHTVAGKHLDMEMQIVHQREGAEGDEGITIVSVLFAAPSVSSPANEWLQDAFQWDHLPSLAGSRRDLTNPFHLGVGIVGLNNGYYSYVGSLTTPPCSANVNWRVVETVQTFSFEQLHAIRSVFQGNAKFAAGRGNNRNVQPLAGRNVYLHNHRQVGDGDGMPVPLPPSDMESAHASAAAVPSQTLQPEDYDGKKRAELDAQTQNRPETLPLLYAHHGSDWSGTCSTGRSQSPIDIRLSKGTPHGDFEMSPTYAETHVKGIVNAGFALKLSLGASPGHVTVDGADYPLTEITVHTPAEHLLDGRRADLELQLVHSLPTKSMLAGYKADYAVVSVLFRDAGSATSDLLESLGEDMPQTAGQQVALGEGARFNLNRIKGLSDGFYSYTGSLSAPPCTEGVKRFVLRTIQDMDTRQVKLWQSVIYGNYRDPQPRNGRGVHSQNVALHPDTVPPEV